MKQRELGIGIGLVVLGLIFLVGPWLNLEAFGWPFFVIVPGVILLFLAFTRTVGNGALAVPGSIVTVTGLILLVLNIMQRMDAWAYAWGLIMAAAGIGTYLHGTISDNAKLKKNGQRTAIIGLLLFVGFGLIFELFIYGTLGNVIRWLVPVLFIVAGALLIYFGQRSKATPKVHTPPSAPAPQVVAPPSSRVPATTPGSTPPTTQPPTTVGPAKPKSTEPGQQDPD